MDPRQRVEQAALLTTHMQSYERVQPGIFPIMGATIGVVGAAGLVALPFVDDSGFKTSAFKISALSCAALWLLGGATTLFADEPWRAGILTGTVSLGVGVVFMGLGFEQAESNGSSHTEPYIVALGAGFAASGALALISTLIGRPTGLSLLKADYQMLRTPALRAQRTAAELNAIETRLRLSEPVIPFVLQLAPQWIGALVAGVGAALDRSLDSQKRLGVIGMALSLSLPSLIIAMTRRNSYASYAADREHLGWDVGLSAAPGMAGMRISATF